MEICVSVNKVSVDNDYEILVVNGNVDMIYFNFNNYL